MRVLKIAGWSAAVVVSLLAAAIAFAVGWQLPPDYECGTGDSCEARLLSVDWDIVTWDLRPARIGCFEPNPDRNTPIIGPGDECVSASGDRPDIRRTYEQLRDDIQRRRLITLVVVAAFLAATPAAALIRLTRRRVNRATR